MEGRHLIALQRGGANVSLEPGGQFELSGAPLETMHAICAETGRPPRRGGPWPTAWAWASSAWASTRPWTREQCR
jgi:hypothetical protein